MIYTDVPILFVSMPFWMKAMIKNKQQMNSYSRLELEEKILRDI